MKLEWNIARARQMRKNGLSYDAIGRHFGVPGSTVNTRLNPNYASARREDCQRWRRKKREADAAAAEPWDENVARQMREEGKSFKAIGKRFGVEEHTVHARLDPEYAKRRRQRNGRTTKAVREHVRPAIDDAEAFRQLAAMPKYETRSLTGIIMGDPPPHRSALAMRNASAG